MDAIRRQRRLQSLRSRIAGPQDAYERCRAYPCPNRTTADRGEGLNRLYCRRHIEFYRRHGSYVKRSYSAGELKPYRVLAAQWLNERPGEAAVGLARAAVERLFKSAGAPIQAFRLSGRTPAERARATWAHLRAREVDPMKVLGAWLAVDMRLRDDPQPDHRLEYRHVQVAKLIHRLAGGTHRRWEHEAADGRVSVTELHKHPVSRGRVLRLIGQDVATACADLTLSR